MDNRFVVKDHNGNTMLEVRITGPGEFKFRPSEDRTGVAIVEFQSKAEESFLLQLEVHHSANVKVQENGREEILDKELAELGFKPRAVNILAKAGITTLDNLLKTPLHSLMNIAMIGPATFRHISERLHELGFGPSVVEE